MMYREFFDLTDDEIIFIIRDIFPNTSNVNNIKRDFDGSNIYCDIYIMEDCPDYADTIALTIPSGFEPGITTHDFVLTDDEIWKWQQYLLAKGCDPQGALVNQLVQIYRLFCIK